MYLFQILLPRADNEGEPFARDDFDRVKEDLVRRYDGVTAYIQAPAEGLWLQEEETQGDDIVIFEVMTERLDLAEWRARRRELERRFRQEKVIIRYMQMTLV